MSRQCLPLGASQLVCSLTLRHSRVLDQPMMSDSLYRFNIFLTYFQSPISHFFIKHCKRSSLSERVKVLIHSYAEYMSQKFSEVRRQQRKPTCSLPPFFDANMSLDAYIITVMLDTPFCCTLLISLTWDSCRLKLAQRRAKCEAWAYLEAIVIVAMPLKSFRNGRSTSTHIFHYFCKQGPKACEHLFNQTFFGQCFSSLTASGYLISE